MGMISQIRHGGFWVFLTIGLALQPASALAASVDQNAIHHAYNEGDFDAVIKLTHQFTNGNATYSRADSLFVFKHLAVVYTANPETREKGKFYMYRMLEMFPSAELVEMYVSDDVDRIFDKVRKEFMMRQKNFGVDTTLIRLPEKESIARSSGSATQAAPQAQTKSQGVGPVWYWVAGGAVLAGAGLATVLLLQPDETEGKTYVISRK